ncbi:MAG: hypothetical protein ACI841_005325 [Planctomycetota bacterium]|jgi:hypothetical protein
MGTRSMLPWVASTGEGRRGQNCRLDEPNTRSEPRLRQSPGAMGLALKGGDPVDGSPARIESSVADTDGVLNLSIASGYRAKFERAR